MKINIENYESMTPEEKVAALEASYADSEKMKNALDKATSEAAAYKKQLREKQTDEEVKEAERASKEAAIMAELEALRHEKVVGTYTASYLAMGYDEKLAKTTAEAMAKGDTETVFKNQKAHLEAREKALRTELLMQTPAPSPGKSDAGVSREEVSKMTLAEKVKFAQDNPEIYKEFFGGN